MNYRAIPKPGRLFRNPPNKPVVNLKPAHKKIVPAIKTSKKSIVIHTKPQQATTRAALRQVAKQNNVQQQQQQHQKQRQPRNKINIQTKKHTVQTQRRTKSITNTSTDFRNEILGLKGAGRGRILVILANGPSMAEVPVEKLNGHPLIDIMCINKPDMRVWPVKYWAFSDQSQYNRHKELFNSFQNKIINSTAVKARRHSNQIVIRGLNGQGFSRDLLRGFHIGRSTVYANMQTALWMEYEKCFIFGMDMCKVGDKLWWYGENPDVKADVREERFKKEAENYDRAFKVLKSDEQIFTICSSYNPWPFVDKFGRMNHVDAVQYIIDIANKKLDDNKKKIK